MALMLRLVMDIEKHNMLKAGSTSLISKFTALVSDGVSKYQAKETNFYTADIDKDGVDEIFFTCRHNASLPWQNSYIQVFKFSAGYWENATSRIIKNNETSGTETLVTGDFNGDGLVDIFSATYTDLNYFLPSYFFTNTGGASLVSAAVDFNAWQHGVFAYDVNKDGFVDIVLTDYGSAGHTQNSGIAFGGPNGLTFLSSQGRGLPWGASGVCAGDFLGDGSVTFIVSDGVGYWDGNGPGPDTRLLNYSISDGKLSFNQIANLPAPRFKLSKWAGYNFTDSHDIRPIPFDFNKDGLLDVLIISRPYFTNNQWPEYSEIQFLKNNGAGVFEDVTDSLLVGYNNKTNASYNPQIADFNGDGLLDIFVSSCDYSSYDVSAFLIQQKNGTFVEQGRDFFTKIWQEAVVATRASVNGYVLSDHGRPQHIVKGADGTWYVFSVVGYTENDGLTSKEAVYATPLTFGEFPAKAVVGGANHDRLIGTENSDSVSGLAGNDTLTGLAGDDTLDGGAGDDSMVGGLGDDTYYVDSTGDKVVELANQGTDTVVSDISLSLAKVANVENWVGIGSANIAATGNTLGNALTGNSGSNTIDGGLGNDTLTGGAGADTFVFSSKLAATNTDTITDFVSGVDKIQLSKSVFGKFKAGVAPQANFVSGDANAKALDSNDYLIFNGHQLLYDADGSGKGVAVVVANVVGTVVASDLVVV